MLGFKPTVKRTRMAAIALCVLLEGCLRLFALNPSLDISQYARTTWRVRNGFALGNVYAMAQTPDGYLWFATEFGLVRFDGVRRVVLATTCRPASPGQKCLQPARHA